MLLGCNFIRKYFSRKKGTNRAAERIVRADYGNKKGRKVTTEGYKNKIVF